MSFVDSSSYDESVLREFNDWAEEIHDEIQDGGALSYDSTNVEPIDAEYRKEIGNYLKRAFGMDYSSVMRVLEGTEATYNQRADNFLVSQDMLEDDFCSRELERLAHEQGHRLGRKIIEDRLKPLESEQNVPAEAYRKMVKYLSSENFAERTKVAVGNSFGRDLQYRMDLVDKPPMIYQVKERIAPQELVDTGRDETVEEMVRDIEDMMQELAFGDPYWVS